jgi:uncharacterized protein
MFETSPILRWRNYLEKYQLQGNQCMKCNKIYYPKKYLCTCGSKQFKPINLSGKGKLLTFTQITMPPTAFKKFAPYCIGIVQLEQGPKLLAQITDSSIDELKIGMNVIAAFRKYYVSDNKNTINYGIKFIPFEC